MELLTPADEDQLKAAGVFLAVVLVVGGGCWAFKNRHRAANAKFEPAVGEYLAHSAAFSKAPVEHVDENFALCGKLGSRCRRGKLVIVDVESRRLDSLHFKLPDELRADSPEEVGSVGFLFVKSEKSAWYGPFSHGYAITWDLRVVDWSTKKMAAMISYSSGPPRRAFPIPFYKHGPGRPTGGLLRDLTALPAL